MSKCAPIELDLAREVNGIVEEKKVTTSSKLVVILRFTRLLHNNCTAVLDRQPKVVAKQMMIEGSCRRSDKINSVELHVQHADYLVSFPLSFVLQLESVLPCTTFFSIHLTRDFSQRCSR